MCNRSHRQYEYIPYITHNRPTAMSPWGGGDPSPGSRTPAAAVTLSCDMISLSPLSLQYVK